MPEAKTLSELVQKSRERLTKFPLWLTTGDLKDYDEWLLGREPSYTKKMQRLGGLKGD